MKDLNNRKIPTANWSSRKDQSQSSTDWNLSAFLPDLLKKVRKIFSNLLFASLEKLPWSRPETRLDSQKRGFQGKL
jgi:hypothetical protein